MILTLAILGASLFICVFLLYEAYRCQKIGYFEIKFFSEIFETRFYRDEQPVRYQLGFFSQIIGAILALAIGVIWIVEI